MYLRTVMIFPYFNNMDVIDAIRKQYDPLCGLVEPHITLVFPFEDAITNDKLGWEIENCLRNVSSFKLVLHGVKKHRDIYGNYLFLNVVEGAEELKYINDILYSCLWGKAARDFIYNPHMTIGKFDDIEEMNDAFIKTKDIDDIFETHVQKVSVELVGEHDESIIIIEKYLKQ